MLTVIFAQYFHLLKNEENLVNMKMIEKILLESEYWYRILEFELESTCAWNQDWIQLEVWKVFWELILESLLALFGDWSGQLIMFGDWSDRLALFGDWSDRRALFEDWSGRRALCWGLIIKVYWKKFSAQIEIEILPCVDPQPVTTPLVPAGSSGSLAAGKQTGEIASVYVTGFLS